MIQIKKIPLLGFGAKIPPYINSHSSNCFACNGNIFNPEVNGLEGVISEYFNILKKIQFHGPTYFSQLIKFCTNAIKYEMKNNKQLKYYILLIITDGIIDDLEETIEEIIEACNLPISIIIVGVGNEDFEAMEKLNSSQELLYSSKSNKSVTRDIVGFEKFIDYKDDLNILRAKTLEEIPKQVITYMREHDIIPDRIQEESKYKIIENNSFFSALKDNILIELTKSKIDDISVMQIMNEGIYEYSKELAVEIGKNLRKNLDSSMIIPKERTEISLPIIPQLDLEEFFSKKNKMHSVSQDQIDS